MPSFRSVRSVVLPAMAVLAMTIAACSGGDVALTPQSAHSPSQPRPSMVASMPAPSASPSTSPSPGVSPSTSPSPSPSPSGSAIVLNPTTVAVLPPGTACNGGAGVPENFTATEAGFSVTFTAVSNNTAVATVMPTSPPGTFTVSGTSGASGGSQTTITVSDGTKTATETVDISQCVP